MKPCSKAVTMLLQVRAKTFYAEKAGLSVSDVDVPVIGGHAGITILPLFSQASPDANLSEEQIDQLTKRTQDGGTEVVQAKAGKASFCGSHDAGTADEVVLCSVHNYTDVLTDTTSYTVLLSVWATQSYMK